MDGIDINYWILQTIAMMVTALLIPKLRITSPFGAIFTVIALALINAKVWDAALFFQIPDHFSYQAGLLLLANGLLFWIVVKILPGIETDGILPSLVAPLVFTITSMLISQYGASIDWAELANKGLSYAQDAKNYFQSSSET